MPRFRFPNFMGSPVQPLGLFLLVAWVGPTLRAQPATSLSATPPPAPTVTAPAVPAEPADSPKLTKLFAGHPPRFAPPQLEASTPASTTTRDHPRNTIIRLPTYIVHEPRPISDDDVMTQKGREHAMALRYLGPQNNLDRTLNAVTLTDLWKSIPLLGKIPFVPFASMTYDQRAALIYEKPERKRRFDELLDIEKVGKEIDQAEAPKPEAKPSK